MSNGEDVLDNWEEIDEAGLTNTLHKFQSEKKKSSDSNKSTVADKKILILSNNSPNIFGSEVDLADTDNPFKEQQPMKLLQRSRSSSSGGFANTSSDALDNTYISDASKSPLEEMSTSFQPVMMLLNKPSDEYESATYAQPMQAVKILRRPTQAVERRSSEPKPKAPLKTLKQREQEYAEARLRILGSAKNPEDDKNLNSTPPNQVFASSSNVNPAVTTAAPSATPAAGLSSNATAPTLSSLVTLPPPTRMKATANPGQKLKALPPETINVKNHYYGQQQQMLQQTNFFSHHQTPYASHHLLQYSNPLHSSGVTMPVVTSPPSYPLVQSKNQSVTVNHSNNHNRNQNSYQKQNHQQTTSNQNGKASNWSPSRNSTARSQHQDSILRMPRGPDGSVGFQMRR